jgi:hypothetical protein
MGVGESANFVPAIGSATLTQFDAPPSTDCSGAGLIGTFFGPYSWTELLPADSDLDRDGCTDRDELSGHMFDGTGAGGGGLRDPWSFWDFFDLPSGIPAMRDGSVSGIDFFALLARFGATGDPTVDPLSPPSPAPAYHPAFDRGAVMGPYLWNARAADGSITGTDFFTMLSQFSHTCG